MNTHIHTRIFFDILLIRYVEILNHPKPIIILLRILNERLRLRSAFSVFIFFEVWGAGQNVYLCSVVFPCTGSQGPFLARVS